MHKVLAVLVHIRKGVFFMYNNCFAIGGIDKQPCYIKGGSLRLLNKKTEALIQLYSRYYDDVVEDIRNNFVVEPYWIGDKEQCDTPDVGVYLKNAKYDDLFIFVIDIDTKHETEFSNRIEAAADFVTWSKNNGRHGYFGVRRDVELFDSINLLASSNAKGFISKTKIFAADGTQFDVFCDAPHFIYELGIWEPKPLTDKTQVVYDLLKECEIKRSIEYNKRTDANGNFITLEYRDEEELLALMTDKQRLVFEDLKTISSDCPQREWFSIGCDINVVFPYDDNSDIDLGGSVFLWWSAPGKTFQPQGCANTWEVICNKDNTLHNTKWSEILEVNAFDLPQRDIKDTAQQKIEVEKEETQEHSKEDETNNILFFRGKPINWVDIPRYKTTEIENAFIEDIEIEERYNGKNHLIGYDEKEYTQDEFLETHFERYREIQKRIQFNTDALNVLNCISTNQCEKLQYHILAQHFDLVEVDDQDELELRVFAFYYDSSFKRLYNRINWENGLSKMITFGAGLQVKGREKVEKMYCYRQHLEHDKAEYIAVTMTWETWSNSIIERAKMKQIDEAIKAMYYQDKIYMTWAAAERNAVEHWIRTYKSGAVFPYSGEIERGESFTIVFDSDCKIVDNIRTRETRAQYNKEHAAELAAARGKIKHSKAAMSDYKRLIGENWTTAELLTMLDNNPKKIKRLVDEGLIERIKRGYYRRKTS